ncbi:isochorismatase family protein [Paenibacillus piri]|uniref:Isochorismatase family protein n=1 Tax=Paenibacillus piri TaxID=2547395 RepID=A0A4R5KC37_9BACL|nr:isochorismatase family protein [Paenibacillus piri]TDF91697.1 isochorismatase family protein [Paenibacillus piri]
MFINLSTTTQHLILTENGYRTWRVETKDQRFAVNQTAILVCDMWDRHWSKGATERVAKMAIRMNDVLKAMRLKGVQIIFAPSDTMIFYADSPARKRVSEVQLMDLPPVRLEIAEHRLPIDDSDGGSDTEDYHEVNSRVWSRQHPLLEIDETVDGISDDGREVYSFLSQKGISNIIFMGVHTNMCVLNRSFAIKRLRGWGFNVVLSRDLTDAMYNPARAPYVSHEEGTRLVVEYIEKFWCPTVTLDRFS